LTTALGSCENVHAGLTCRFGSRWIQRGQARDRRDTQRPRGRERPWSRRRNRCRESSAWSGGGWLVCPQLADAGVGANSGPLAHPVAPRPVVAEGTASASTTRSFSGTQVCRTETQAVSVTGLKLAKQPRRRRQLVGSRPDGRLRCADPRRTPDCCDASRRMTHYMAFADPGLSQSVRIRPHFRP